VHENAKRALLIISDGGDNHSRYNENDIKRLVKEADTQLYAIGIFDPLGYRSRTPEELNGPSLLTDVTDMTGGRVFSVEPRDAIEDLPDIATKIGMELRNQYVLGYRPSTKHTTPAGEKSKLSLRPPADCHPCLSMQKPDTTRRAINSIRRILAAAIFAGMSIAALSVFSAHAQAPGQDPLAPAKQPTRASGATTAGRSHQKGRQSRRVAHDGDRRPRTICRRLEAGKTSACSKISPSRNFRSSNARTFPSAWPRHRQQRQHARQAAACERGSAYARPGKQSTGRSVRRQFQRRLLSRPRQGFHEQHSGIEGSPRTHRFARQHGVL